MLSLQGGHEVRTRDNSLYAPANELVMQVNQENANALDPLIGTLFRAIEKDKWQFKQSVFYGTTGSKPVAKNGQYPILTAEGQDDKTIEYRTYGSQVVFNDLDMSFWVEKRMNYRTQLESSMQYDIARINQSHFDVILRGYESSYTNAFGETVVSVDMEGSQPLFSTAHKIKKGTGETYTYNNVILNYKTNKINPAFSVDAILSTQEYAMQVQSETGVPAGINLDTILVPTALAYETLQMLKSMYEPFNANNGTNEVRALTEGSLKYTLNKWLYQDGEGNHTNASTGAKYRESWYLFDSSNVQKTFAHSFWEFPAFKYEHSEDAMTRSYRNRFLYRLAFFDARYIFGSNATEGALPANLQR